MKEIYWIANYNDGSRLCQYDKDEKGQVIRENKYADINRESLERFDLVDKQTERVIHAVYFHEGEQLIYRRRTLKHMDGSPDTIIYLVGWQMTIMAGSGPRNLVVLNYIHADGSVALDGPRDNLQLLEFEL